METGSVIGIDLNSEDGGDFELGVSWDTTPSVIGRKPIPVDIDAQAVLLNSSGKLVDAVYHNQLSAYNSALIHSGDSKDSYAKTKTFNEMNASLWISNGFLSQSRSSCF